MIHSCPQSFTKQLNGEQPFLPILSRDSKQETTNEGLLYRIKVIL